MITRQGFPFMYPAGTWVGRSGKASYMTTDAFIGGEGGYNPAGAIESGGAQMLMMRKPRLMMDPSDPSTWQRPYSFPH